MELVRDLALSIMKLFCFVHWVSLQDAVVLEGFVVVIFLFDSCEVGSFILIKFSNYKITLVTGDGNWVYIHIHTTRLQEAAAWKWLEVSWVCAKRQPGSAPRKQLDTDALGKRPFHQVKQAQMGWKITPIQSHNFLVLLLLKYSSSPEHPPAIILLITTQSRHRELLRNRGTLPG